MVTTWAAYSALPDAINGRSASAVVVGGVGPWYPGGPGIAGEGVVAVQRIVGWLPGGIGEFLVGEGGSLCAAVAHSFGEAGGAVGVVAVGAEVFAGEVPVGAVSRAGCLDVGGLLAGLPAAGEDDGALDGRALLAVDVLGVGEA
jgi:hypothetical protein